MNEQYTADLFSEQLDRVLVGQDPVLASEFGDLEELLSLGEQMSRVNFQPNEAMQQAFQSQLATWFGSAPNGAASLLGLSKGWLLIIGSAVVVIGTALGLARLPGPLFESPGSDSHSLPAIEAEGSPTAAPFGTTEAIGLPGTDDSAEPAPPAAATSTKTAAEKKSSQGDVIRPTTSSLGDTLPTSLPSLGETLPLATAVPTATQEVDITAGDGGDTASGDGGDEASPDSSDSSTRNEDDRGHGNEPDGFDEDNPGESEGVPDPSGGAPGQDKSPSGLNPGDFSRGGDGGGGGGGGAGGQGNGGGQGKGSGRGGGQGQGKGRGNQ